MDWRDIDDPKKERAELLKAIAQKPSAELYYKLGTVYENVKDFKKAIFYGKKAVQLEPDNAEFLEFMAFVHKKKGDIPDAFRYYEHLLELDPGDSQNRIELEMMKEALPFWKEQNKK